jgi:hypothetical protein
MGAVASQAFINTSFENITSTEHALSLLAQFNAILQRDKLKEELDAKYQVCVAWKCSTAGCLCTLLHRHAVHTTVHTSVWFCPLSILEPVSVPKQKITVAAMPSLHISVLHAVVLLLQVIFHHYVKDLEAVQAQYEAFKHKPPVARNMPPIAGNIMWSRQLLRRIEEPMQHFAQNKALMAMKESKKVIKMYNRVSRNNSLYLA